MTTFAIYPCHINSTLSHKHGRKYNKEFCVSNPTIYEMKMAADHLGLEHTLEDNKIHPKTPFVPGRVRFNKTYGRINVVRGLKQEIEELRIMEARKEEIKKENVKAKIGKSVFIPRTKKKKSEKRNKKINKF